MSSEPVVHIISSHELYIAEYKYIRDMCQQDRPKGITLGGSLQMLAHFSLPVNFHYEKYMKHNHEILRMYDHTVFNVGLG